MQDMDWTFSFDGGYVWFIDEQYSEPSFLHF